MDFAYPQEGSDRFSNKSSKSTQSFQEQFAEISNKIRAIGIKHRFSPKLVNALLTAIHLEKIDPYIALAKIENIKAINFIFARWMYTDSLSVSQMDSLLAILSEDLPLQDYQSLKLIELFLKDYRKLKEIILFLNDRNFQGLAREIELNVAKGCYIFRTESKTFSLLMNTYLEPNLHLIDIDDKDVREKLFVTSNLLNFLNDLKKILIPAES